MHATILLFWVLAAAPWLSSPSPAPFSAAEMLGAEGDSEELAPRLRLWLDAYPESARDWTDQELVKVLAHVVGLGEAHHPSSAALANRVARVSLDALAWDVAAVAEAHSLASRVALARGEDRWALELLGLGLARCQSPQGEEQATYCAFMLRDRALVRMRKSRPGLATQDLELAERWLAVYPRSEARVPVLNSAADIACWRGEAERCLALYLEATELAESLFGADSEVAAYGYLGVGWAAALSARWGQARAAFERAEAAWTKTLGADHPRLASALVEYGELLRRAGDAAGARRVLRRAVALREGRLGPLAFDLPRALDALGLAALELGELDEAAVAVTRSAAIRRHSQATSHPEQARTLRVAAQVAQAQGEILEARQILAEALELLRSGLGEAHPEVAEARLDLAELELEREPKTALDRIFRARDTLAVAFGERHPMLARAWALEALARRIAGEDAVTPALRAEAISRRHRRLVSPGLAERDLLTSSGTYPAALDIAIDALLTESEPLEARVLAVWQAIAQSRAPVLEIDRARRAAAVARGGLEAAELDSARRALGRLQTLIAGDDPVSHGRRLEAAQLRVEKAERNLSGLLAAPRMEKLELAAKLGGLRAGEALIAYRIHRGGERLAAFVAVPRDGLQEQALPAFDVSVLDMGPWPPLVRDVAELRTALDGAGEGAYRRISARVRKKLIDPLAPWLVGADRWFLVPDGPLALLPFGAFAEGERGYLIERASIHQVATEGDLSPLDPESGALGPLLAVGGPAFGEPPPAGIVDASAGDSRATRVPSFEPLPEARAEARWVAAAWRLAISTPAELLLGDLATEAQWRARAPTASVLHLATHGFYLPPGSFLPPAFSRMPDIDSRPEGRPGAHKDARGVGSLVEASSDDPRRPEFGLAGFALAGANHLPSPAGPGADPDHRTSERADLEGDDGLVTAEEIRSLDLRRSRLVVLSFCDGGLGTVQRGEGVFGLSRAFRIAGARSMVLALAPVSDRESRLFMERFYGELFDGVALDRALRRAALDRLEERRRVGAETHPIHWGVRVSLGDPSPLVGPFQVTPTP